MEAELAPEVIYEDEHFLAVNKPAGLLVHGIATSTKAEPTLVDWLLLRHPEVRGVGDPAHPAPPGRGGGGPLRPGIVHRLDRDTSGVMVIAKTQPYFEYLKSLFAGRAMKKTYLAVVSGKMKEKEGTIDRPIGIVAGSVRRSTRSSKMEKQAVTNYKVVRTLERGGEAFSVLEVTPLSGRTHQIRVHLASIGHPVVGDPLYGRRSGPGWAPRLMLHAHSLEFAASPGKPIRIEADPPPEFSGLLPPPA